MNANPPAAPPTLPYLSRSLRLQYKADEAHWLLFSPQGMVQLNDSAAEILRRCDGRHTVCDIVRELEMLFETQGIAPQVHALLTESASRGWLDI